MYRQGVSTLMLLIVAILWTPGSAITESCQYRTYNEPGDVNFAVISSLRSPEPNATCGDVSYRSLQALLAIKYTLSKLNSPSSVNNQSFIPGVQIGITVFDDCGNDKYALASATSAIRRQFSSKLVKCDKPRAPLFAGFLGPTRSQSATAVSGLLDGTRIPLVGMATTLSELSNKTKYPNVLRTAVSDEKQSKAIISLVKRLGWTVIAILHTEDSYATDLSSSVQRLAKQNQICVLRVLSIDDLRGINEAIKILLQQQAETADNSLGVVYLGQGEWVKFLMNRLCTEYNDKRVSIGNLKWILPDSVGTSTEIINRFDCSSQQGHLRSVWSISPTSLPLVEFRETVRSEMLRAKNNFSSTPNQWLSEFIQTSCQPPFAEAGCSEFKQGSYIPSVIHAVYAMSFALKHVHDKSCNGTPGICDGLKSKQTIELLNEVRKVSFQYADLDARHTVPEMAIAGTSISFDDHGDMTHRQEEEIFAINKFSEQDFIKVGSYYENGRLDLNQSTKSLSRCGKICQGCVHDPGFVYLPGEILLAGFFSLHWAPPEEEPFGCGTFRTEVHTVISVEAFFYTVRKMRQETGKNFGAIIFDDCYSFLKADSIISKYFSGETQLTDPKTGDIIDLSKVVGVIGSESSSVSLPLAESFTRLRLPIISYASTSPDLDEKGLYPYSLRTSVSDRNSVEVIVALIKHFGWTYVNIVYSNNNYGYKAMLLTVEKAKDQNICVAKPIPIKVTPNEKDLTDIVKILNANVARVVVYIGLEEDSIAFQKIIQFQKLDLVFLALEDWAVSLRPNLGAEQATVGSIVVLPMAPKLPWNDFPEYLTKVPTSWTNTSLWFDMFWQSHFKCNIPERFQNRYSIDCNSNLSIKLSTAQSWARQFRVGNTINAVASMITGIFKAHKFLCLTHSDFACQTLKQNPANVTAYIKRVSLGAEDQSYRPFKDDGNGNVNFRLLNLQRLTNGSYVYVPVGSYDTLTGKLQLNENSPVKFYKNNREVKKIDGSCTVQKICRMCEASTSTGESALSSSSCDSNHLHVAILVILCILVVLVVVILVFIIRRKHNKDVVIDKTNGTVVIPERRHPSEEVNPNRVANSFSPFQNPPSNYNSSYLSHNPNGTLENIDGRGTIIPQGAFSVNQQYNPTTQRAHESQYLNPASLISSSSNTESRSGTSSRKQTQPKTLDSPSGPSDRRYLRLGNSDTTFPKVLNDLPTHQNVSNTPPTLNVYTHPMRNQRLAAQNDIDHNTHPKTIVGTVHQEVKEPRESVNTYVNMKTSSRPDQNTEHDLQLNTSDEANATRSSSDFQLSNGVRGNSGTENPDDAPVTLPSTKASSTIPVVGSAPPGSPSSTFISTSSEKPNSEQRLSSFKTSTPIDRLSDLDTTCV